MARRSTQASVVQTEEEEEGKQADLEAHGEKDVGEHSEAPEGLPELGLPRVGNSGHDPVQVPRREKEEIRPAHSFAETDPVGESRCRIALEVAALSPS